MNITNSVYALIGGFLLDLFWEIRIRHGILHVSLVNISVDTRKY